MARINVEHGVSANKADIATNGPCARARVIQSPRLLEHGVRRQFSTVRDGIPNEVGLVISEGAFLDSRLNARRLCDWGWLDLFGFARIHFHRCLFNDWLLLLVAYGGGHDGFGASTSIITKGDSPTEAIVADSAHRHGANGSLELDQRVGLVVVVGRKSLAARTKVDIVTDGTLVANSRNVALGRLVVAQGSVAEDAIVNGEFTRLIANSLINGGEPVARMVLGSLDDAVWAVVPIRARQALVAGTNDALESCQLDSIKLR